jgi:hypothetical protein
MPRKTIAKLLVVSLVILTGSPALATQIVRQVLTVVPLNKKRACVVIGHSGRASRVRAAHRVGTVGIQRTMIGRDDTGITPDRAVLHWQRVSLGVCTENLI